MKLRHDSVDIESDAEAFFAQMGKLAALIATTPAFAKISMDIGLSMIQGAMQNKSFCIYEDNSGRPVAALIWASLDEQEKAFYLRYGMLRDQSAWNSGPQVWLLNVIARDGMIKTMFADMRQTLFKDHTEVFMLRPGKTARRVVRMTHKGAQVVQTLPPAIEPRHDQASDTRSTRLSP